MEYREKYLKYKNKYLKLKNQRGGNQELFELFMYNSPETDEKAIKIINTLSDVNIKHRIGFSLLSFALIRRKSSIVSLLIEKGANINIINDSYDTTPLMDFLDIREYDSNESEDYRLVEYLIEKGANINYENYKKETALSICIKQRLYNILELLFSKNVEIKSDVYEGCPLSMLMKNTRIIKYDISEFLLSEKFGIKPEQKKSEHIELLAIKFIKKGALVKENSMEKVKNLIIKSNIKD
jgi:ankyrin repeat protein